MQFFNSISNYQLQNLRLSKTSTIKREKHPLYISTIFIYVEKHPFHLHKKVQTRPSPSYVYISKFKKKPAKVDELSE